MYIIKKRKNNSQKIKLTAKLGGREGCDEEGGGVKLKEFYQFKVLSKNISSHRESTFFNYPNP